MVSKTVASNADIVANNDFKSLVREKSLVELFPVGMSVRHCCDIVVISPKCDMCDFSEVDYV